jgi:ABC-type glycerol-3-phosphate transport system substrate-binding protein
MNVFIKGVGQLPPSAYVDNYNLHFGQVGNEVRDRVTQVITGELTVDKALELAQTKAKELLKQ